MHLSSCVTPKTDVSRHNTFSDRINHVCAGGICMDGTVFRGDPGYR